MWVRLVWTHSDRPVSVSYVLRLVSSNNCVYLDEWWVEEDLGGVGGGETVIRITVEMKNFYFNKKISLLYNTDLERFKCTCAQMKSWREGNRDMFAMPASSCPFNFWRQAAGNGQGWRSLLLKDPWLFLGSSRDSCRKPPMSLSSSVRRDWQETLNDTRTTTKQVPWVASLSWPSWLFFVDFPVLFWERRTGILKFKGIVLSRHSKAAAHMDSQLLWQHAQDLFKSQTARTSAERQGWAWSPTPS